MNNQIPAEELKSALADAISDMSKDLNGFRHRWDWQAMTVTELEEMYRDYIAQLSARIDEEREWEALAIDSWVKHIVSISSQFRVSHADAVRWDMDAEEAEDDVGRYAWCRQLPCSIEGVISAVRAGDACLVAH